MAHTISGTYSTLVALGTPMNNPTTITATGLLNGSLLVAYGGVAVVNAGSIAGSRCKTTGMRLGAFTGYAAQSDRRGS